MVETGPGMILVETGLGVTVEETGTGMTVVETEGWPGDGFEPTGT